jgi:hypothetical protein
MSRHYERTIGHSARLGAHLPGLVQWGKGWQRLGCGDVEPFGPNLNELANWNSSFFGSYLRRLTRTGGLGCAGTSAVSMALAACSTDPKDVSLLVMIKNIASI